MAFFEGRSLVLILRAIQAFLTVLILGLTGYGTSLTTSPPTQSTRLTSACSRQLVGQLLACRRAIASRLPPLLRSTHLDHSDLLDRRAYALRRKQAQQNCDHHGCRRPNDGLLVRRFRCAGSLPER